MIGAAVAQAAPIPVPTLLADFNAIIDGNYNATSESVGPVLIGGNLSSTGILNTSGIALPVPIAGYGQVDVFGNNLATSHPIVQNSLTLIGGANLGSIINPGPGSVLGGYIFPGTGFASNNNPLTFATDVWAPLTALSLPTSLRRSLL